MTDSKKKTTAAKTKTAATSAKKTTAVKKVTTTALPVTAQSDLPTAEALKERFKAGSIPLQSDFADLIDMADIGRQAVGESAGTGWGLVKDSQGRLRWDLKGILNASYDLSPSTSSDRALISEQYAGATNEHNKVALLSLKEDVGPTEAVNTQEGDSTLFKLAAFKTDGNGKRTAIVVSLIGKKSVGKTADFVPFEYVTTSSASYSIWYQFTLDTSTEDFSNCTLVIDPLVLSINHITDASTDPVGDVLALMVVNFTYTGVRQIIPKGLISMFSGSTAPSGWAICDGTQGTPDLRNRFIVGAGSDFSGKGDGTVKTDNATSKGSVKISDTVLDTNQIPSHHHDLTLNSFSYVYDVSDELVVGALHVEKNQLQVLRYGKDASGTSSSTTTSSSGGTKGHSHSATLTMQEHSHNISPIPPFYALAFIMKL